MSQPAEPAPAARRLRVRLHGWLHPTILACAALSAASGFAQFSAIAALGDVARAFGEVTDGPGLAAQVGLSGTVLGIGLGIIRIASLASLPIAGLADQVGRRKVLLAACAGGLALTVAASASPGFWWFIAAFALARPMLSATNAVAGVIAAEDTPSDQRAKAIMLITAGYGVGAGITALLRGMAGDLLGFRGLFLVALVPLGLLVLLRRYVSEPDRFTVLHDVQATPRRLPVLGVFSRPTRRRLLALAAITFLLAFVVGPVVGYLFVYAEGVLGMTRAATAWVVLAAAPTGLVGLLIGRWCADRLGRRITAGLAQAVVASSAVLTYAGRPAGAVAGYLLNILASSVYAPAMGALSAELFPTSIRATAAGWLTCSSVLGAVSGLVAFGVLADAFDGFGPAALLLAIPGVAASLLFLLVPETRGLELEESAPETAGAGDVT